MKAVVLGGTGFLGSHVSRTLASMGLDVVVVGRNLPKSQLANITYFSDTLDNSTLLRRVLSDADFVFHLASDTTPGSSARQPSLDVANNILPTARLLEVLHACSKIHLIFVSSGGAVYADGQRSQTEQSETKPLSYYGAAKLGIEHLLQAFSWQSGHRVTVLRPSNIYGPGQTRKTNFGIVPTLFNCALNSTPFSIWGDGGNIRDYLYIDDFASFCAAVVDRSKQITDSYDVLNVGAGCGTSVSELCDRVEGVAGRPIVKKFLPERGVDIKRIVLDCTKSHRVLGWRPTTSIEKGLEETWNWLNEYQQ